MGGYVGVNTTLYTPLDYIESSGTQYIDTGIIPTSLTKVEFDANIVSGASNQWLPIYGARSYTTSNYVTATYLCLYIHSDSHHLSPNYAGFDPGTGGNTTINFNQRYLLTQDRGQFYIDGVLKPGISTTNTITTGNKTMYLFTNNSAGETQFRGQDVKLYGCKIYENNVIVRDFIPVLDRNNVACLYDLVEGKFYYNSGTGTFTSGTADTPVIADVARKIKKGYVGITSTYTPVEYIESSGTQYIDTGVPASATLKTLCDMSTTTGGYPFGVTPAQNVKYYGANVSTTNQRIQSYFGTTSSYITTNNVWTQGQRFVLTANDNYKFYKDSTQIADYTTGTTKEFDNSLSITIFALNGLYLSSRITMKLYGFKMYDGGTLVRDFIPVLDQDNVACLYDLVDGKFYYNGGTGTFTAGSATGSAVTVGDRARKIIKGYVGIPTSYTPVEYIESTGTQYIDTGALITTDLTVDCKWASTGTTNGLNGAYTDESGIGIRCLCFGDYNGFIYQGIGSSRVSNISSTLNTEYITTTTASSMQTTSGGSVITSVSGSLLAKNVNFFLCCASDVNNTTNYFAKEKIYYCKLYKNGVLIRDFIPVLDQDNVACLYEQAEGKLYYNKGSGAFTAGNTTGEPVSIGSKARVCFTSGPELPASTTVLAHFDGTTECAIPSGTNITSGSSFGAGKFDQGYNGGSSEKDYLSGVSSLIYSPRDIITSGYSQTISFWAKLASNYNISFSYGSAVSGGERQQTGYIIKISNNVCTGFLFRETGSGTQYWKTFETSGYNIPVVDGQYHNFVLEMYPGGAKAFVDGHSIGTVNMSSAYGTYAKDLRITGMVDEIMVAREVVHTQDFEVPDEPYST